jgi:hypothetical protein
MRIHNLLALSELYGPLKSVNFRGFFFILLKPLFPLPIKVKWNIEFNITGDSMEYRELGRACRHDHAANGVALDIDAAYIGLYDPWCETFLPSGGKRQRRRPASTFRGDNGPDR